MTRKYSKPLTLDGSFGEVLGRFARVDSAELQDNFRKSEQKSAEIKQRVRETEQSISDGPRRGRKKFTI